MATIGNNLVAKSGIEMASKYYCESCDYKCFKKYNWDKHILTSKHINSTNGNELATENGKKWQKDTIYCCENCNKEYNDRSGLWKHKKKCKSNENNDDKIKKSDEHSDKEIIMMLIKDNNEFKNMMMKVLENGTNNTTHTNSHNKSFNLQFFLNETCKDAMNIMDFVESIQLQLSDLENVGKVGYVEGISNIIVKNLKALDVTQRPVHCTDKKREVLYVKDENKWEKQDEENVKLRKAIKKVTDKNMRLIPKYREKYPDCNKSISRHSDQYNKIIVESMGGSGDNDHEKASKIIKNITKQVLVEKEQESDSI